MRLKELIERLAQYPPDTVVTVSEDVGGNGINLELPDGGFDVVYVEDERVRARREGREEE